MSLISRRKFLKLSASTLIGICLLNKLPVLSSNKIFKPFKFAFVPDCHLSTSKQDDWILLNESYLILQDTIKVLNNLNLDFVVFGGDQINNETKDLKELSSFIDIVYQLEKPYYVLFGDREARLNNDLSKEDFASEFRRNGFIDRGITYWIHNPVKGVDLIGLDSSVINQMEGDISADQLVWLSDVLKKNPNNLKVITLHHPLMPTQNNFYKTNGFQMKNANVLMDLIDRYQNVELVLSGHHHVNYITSKGMTHYVNSPSIVTYPCEFRVIEVNNDYINIKNIQISFKQMINKAEDLLGNSNYARNFTNIKPKALLNLQRGEKSSRNAKLKI